MQIQEAIHSRRTAHLWQDVPVPEEAILRGLEAAQMAPCHRLTWPWRFTLPGPSARSRLYDIGVELKAAKAGVEPSEELRERMVAKMRHPALIVVSQLVDERTYELLGIAQAEESIIGFFWAGVPVRAGATPQRPDLAAQVRRVP